jgi:hypothetical protein
MERYGTLQPPCPCLHLYPQSLPFSLPAIHTTSQDSHFFFLIGKKSILYKKRKVPLSTLVVYRENTYLEIEKRVRKSEKEIYKGWT